MYYKKQLVFIAGAALLVIYTLFEQHKTNSIRSIIKLVNITVTHTSCFTTKHSFYMFQYNNKSYKRGISQSECKNLKEGSKMSLYYYPKDDEFYDLQVLEEDYYRKALYFFIPCLIVTLIPYKLFS